MGHALRVYVPEPVRRRALVELIEATAGAFGVARPPIGGRSGELLRRYASFTAEQASAVLASGRPSTPVRQDLYGAARAIGARLRDDLDLGSAGDAMAAARVVYGILGIDFQVRAGGEIRIPRCFFSRFYTPQVCVVMSALDQGLLAGLSGGGHVEFRQRITEGAPCCAATFAEVSS